MSEKKVEAPKSLWIGYDINSTKLTIERRPNDIRLRLETRDGHEMLFYLTGEWPQQIATALSLLQQPTGERCGEYAPSSARETRRLIDAIEQSIRSLSSPLGPMETATRIRLAAEYGLSYVAALRERLERDGVATTGAPPIEKAAQLADEYARQLRSVNNHAVAAGVEVLAKEIRELAVATTGAGAVVQRTATSVSALMGYEAALREANECEKCDLCEDHLPATVAEGQAHRCPRCGRAMKSDFDPDVGMWYECENCDYREAISSAPAPVQPVAAGQDGPRIRTATIRICQPCVDLEGQECHTPECVFCFRSVTEAKWLMDKMMIAPIIDGERFVLVDEDEPSTPTLGEGATNFIHLPQYPLNGTQLECDGSELRPDGTCAKCERINERIESHYAALPPTEATQQQEG